MAQTRRRARKSERRQTQRKPAQVNRKLRYFGSSTDQQHFERTKQALHFIKLPIHVALDIQQLHGYLEPLTRFIQQTVYRKLAVSRRPELAEPTTDVRCSEYCQSNAHYHVVDLGVFVEELSRGGLAPATQEAVLKTIYKCFIPHIDVIDYEPFADHWGNNANSMKTQWTAYLRTFGVGTTAKPGVSLRCYDIAKIFDPLFITGHRSLLVDIGDLNITRLASPRYFDPFWQPKEPSGWTIMAPPDPGASSSDGSLQPVAPMRPQSSSPLSSLLLDFGSAYQEYQHLDPGLGTVRYLPEYTPTRNGRSAPAQSSAPFPDSTVQEFSYPSSALPPPPLFSLGRPEPVPYEYPSPYLPATPENPLPGFHPYYLNLPQPTRYQPRNRQSTLRDFTLPLFAAPNPSPSTQYRQEPNHRDLPLRAHDPDGAIIDMTHVPDRNSTSSVSEFERAPLYDPALPRPLFTDPDLFPEHPEPILEEPFVQFPEPRSPVQEQARVREEEQAQARAGQQVQERDAQQARVRAMQQSQVTARQLLESLNQNPYDEYLARQRGPPDSPSGVPWDEWIDFNPQDVPDF